jgi:putative ABC transport system permease protein
VAVEGKSGAVGVNLFQGDSRKAAYDIISGRWFTAPGEVVAPSRFLASTGTRVGDSIVLVDQGERVRVRIVGEDFDPTGSGMQLAADVRTIPRELASGTVEFVHADPRAGVTVDAYLKQLNGSLQPIGAGAAVNSAGPGGSMVVVIEAMSLLLTLMLLATAGLGILNSVVLDTRERVRDLGICRALGMTPGQTTAQVLVTVAGLGLAGGLAGAPLGIALHHAVMPMVLHAVGSNTPGRVQNVFGGVEVVGLVVGGSLLAMAGGMLPASWAARARTAVILRTE